MTAVARPIDAPNAPEVEAAFRAVPEEQVAEILDGELHTQPRPAPAHANAASVLSGELHGPFRRGRGGPGGWVFLVEPELHLGPRPDILVPDLAGYRRERLPELPAEAYLPLAPDWLCEVLSPRTEATDRGKKLRIYRREAVPHVWLVNPISRTLEVYRLEGGRYALLDTYEDAETVRAEPFEAFELELALLWAP